ncbi:ComEC/Rec2 family competence protein [Candidatus Kuenenbacteria bacterium]|nr:ComEC/Rec2 family competence protein [Candidatus Kuenenbacteria bacterium]
MKLTKSQKFFYGSLLLLIAIALFDLFLGVPKFNEKHISFYNNQNTTFEAVISAEPDVRLDHQKLTVEPTKLKGKVLLRTQLYPEYEYGALLEVTCKLQMPEQIENFKYDKYLARYGIYSVCYQPKIRVLDSGKGNFMMAGVLKLKGFMQLKINQTVSEPQAALVGGILVGARQGIPQDLLGKFNITGITHIIAISGFNITIIVVLLLNLFKTLQINRKKAIWGILFGLIFFVILTGMSASVVRAAIMGMIVLFAKHIGRPGKVRNVLVLSAVIMAIFNPKILIWDAGFQLSFVATIGLVYLSPKLLPYFKWLPAKLAIRENSVSTLSAILFTLPLILFQFGRLSVVAPIVNLLVLPIIPIAMFVGFIQFIFASVNLFLGQIVGWFSWLLLGYLVKVVEIFASFKWASLEIKISWWVMVVLYLVLFKIIFSNKKSRQDES